MHNMFDLLQRTYMTFRYRDGTDMGALTEMAYYFIQMLEVTFNAWPIRINRSIQKFIID